MSSFHTRSAHQGNSGGGTTNSTTDFSTKIDPQRLELSLNEDGSLQASTLSQVILAVTDALYNDIYSMVQGEIDVALPSAPVEDDTATPEQHPETSHLRKSERMANLSFVQRRHELAWRLAANAKRVQMASAVAAATIGPTVRVCTTALQHTRTAWIQADEAQDALYFFHNQFLFAGRAAPHDVYGAADLVGRGRWYDVPSDVQLKMVGRWTAAEDWTRQETEQRWHLAVRNVLVRGEVGAWRRQQQQQQQQMDSSEETTKEQQQQQQPVWKISLQGGIVKLTHGSPKRMEDGKELYPIEVLLTVLPPEPSSEQNDAEASKNETTTTNDAADDSATIPAASKTNDENESSTSQSSSTTPYAWTLLSITVNVQPKTGEFDHQLTCSNRQRYDLHRLAVLALHRSRDTTPLTTLFHLSNSFLLQWQLEVLSAQAQALRRGVWSAGSAAGVHIESVVYDAAANTTGSMSIAFWSVDDTYGSPCLVNVQTGAATTVRASQKLQLLIRADTTCGVQVALSGATLADAEHPETQLLLQATSNPLALSTSDALLAATKLCAERKCRAAVEALLGGLPDWISLEHCGSSIAVAAIVHYHTTAATMNGHASSVTGSSSSQPVLLFHIRCDLRTGTFVNTFPRSMDVLRRLASNDVAASTAMALRLAALPDSRRRTAGAHSTGRLVKEIMDAFLRSMNLLGRRVGVGGSWDDIDEQSSMLRKRAIQTACQDVRTALMDCCGVVALYGLVPLAYSTALGLDAVADL